MPCHLILLHLTILITLGEEYELCSFLKPTLMYLRMRTNIVLASCSQRHAPSFTTIQNHRQYYSCVYTFSEGKLLHKVKCTIPVVDRGGLLGCVLDNRLTDDGEVSLMRRPRSTPRNNFNCLCY
jgi:hypothetical protein